MSPEDIARWSRAIEATLEDRLGIRLDEHCGAWSAAAGRLRLGAAERPLIDLDLSDAEGPEDAPDLLEDEDGLRRALSRARLDLIEEQSRRTLELQLATVLGDEGWELEYLEAGHWPSHHGMVEEEYLRDYPQMVAEVHLEGDEDDPLGLRLDPYQPPWFDQGELDELLEQLRAREDR